MQLQSPSGRLQSNVIPWTQILARRCFAIDTQDLCQALRAQNEEKSGEREGEDHRSVVTPYIHIIRRRSRLFEGFQAQCRLSSVVPCLPTCSACQCCQAVAIRVGGSTDLPTRLRPYAKLSTTHVFPSRRARK